MSDRTRPSVGIVGAGRLARAIARPLRDAGYPIAAVHAPRRAAARSLCRSIPGAKVTASPDGVARDATIILLAIPDREIAPVAAALARSATGPWKGKTVLHHAGALGPRPLAPLMRRGAATGVLHPLQCLGRGKLATDVLAGSRVRIEGDPRAVRVARRMARDLGMVPLALSPKLSDADRTLYHAAASVMSNDLVALLDGATGLLESIGLSRRDAISALAALAEGTLRQASAGGIGAALSGPVVRGDAAVLQEHLRRLRRSAPATASVHELLSARLLEIAVREGEGPDPEARRQIARALGSGVGGRSRGRGV